MSVTISTTNKPLNPRAQDLSPKGYNRASLYSGKALDFDGVNDAVNLGAFGGTYNDLTMIWNLKTSYVSDYQAIFVNGDAKFDVYITPSGQIQLYQGAVYATSSIPVIQTGKWINLVFTREGEIGKVYYNGILVETFAVSNLAFTNTNARLGLNPSSVYDYNGQMANFKIFNTALTAAQVSDLYLNPEKIVPDGVANSALKLWLPMMEGAGTTCYNGVAVEEITNGDFSDGSTGWTITNGSITGGKYVSGALSAYQSGIKRTSFSRTGTYIVQFDLEVTSGSIRVDDGGAISTYSTTGRVYHTSTNPTKLEFNAYNLGFNGTIDNVSVLQVGGLISGATWVSGVGAPVAQTALVGWNKPTIGGNAVLIPQGLTANKDIFGNSVSRNAYALNLDGASWAEVHDNASLDFGTGAFTLEAWAKVKYVNAGSSVNVILSLGNQINSTDSAGLATDNNSKANFWYTNTSFSNVLNAGDWVHIVGVYDETNATLYVNGSQVDQDARTAESKTNALTKYIGRDNQATRYYHDQIALPRIYNRALTATEVSRNYNADKSKFGL